MPQTELLNDIAVNIRKGKDSSFNLKNCIFLYYLYCSAWHISLCFSFPCNCQPLKLLFFYHVSITFRFLSSRVILGRKKTVLISILVALRFTHTVKKLKKVYAKWGIRMLSHFLQNQISSSLYHCLNLSPN